MIQIISEIIHIHIINMNKSIEGDGIMRLFKKLAILRASAQYDIPNANEILKHAIKKEKALKYLTRYNPDSNTMDNTLDRIWIEHQPYNTVYEYTECKPNDSLGILKSKFEINGELIFKLKMQDIELYSFMEDKFSDTAIVISTTGNIFNIIRKHYNGLIKINISGTEIKVDINKYISTSGIVPREISINNTTINKIIGVR